MSSAYRRSLIEDRRLVILQILSRSEETANVRVLYSELPDVGHRVGMDELRTELSWLDRQGLIELSGSDVLVVATLTERGLDAAHGRITVPGVRRPAPHERR